MRSFDFLTEEYRLAAHVAADLAFGVTGGKYVFFFEEGYGLAAVARDGRMKPIRIEIPSVGTEQ